MARRRGASKAPGPTKTPKPKAPKVVGAGRTGRPPGQTIIDTQERVENVVRMLVQRAGKTMIRKACRELWGRLSHQTIDKYIKRARELMRARSERDAAELVSDALATYESIIGDPIATLLDKTRAQRCIDNLMGLARPKRVELTGAGGAPLTPQQAELHLLVRAMLDEEARPDGDTDAGHGAGEGEGASS